VLSDRQKYKYSFRNCLDSKYAFYYVSGLMKYVNQEFGYNKVFIATQDVLWASTIGDLMAKWFKENGWTVIDFQRYPTGATDFSSGLLRARQAGAQVILPVFDMPTSGVLVKQWRSMKVPALMAGFVSPFSGTKAWQTFQGEIEGAVHVMWEIGHIPVKGYAPAGRFYDAYRKRWGEEVQSGHGVSAAYDAVYVLANAIERAGTTDPDKVADAIARTDMAGSVGRIKYDQGHQLIFGNDPNTTALAAAFQWRKGRRLVIFPASIAESKIEKPGWMK
jgi:branched-chain amino acid transport system substrate-binding protein